MFRGETRRLSDGESMKANLPFELCGKTLGEFEIILDKSVKISYDGKLFRVEFMNETVGNSGNVLIFQMHSVMKAFRSTEQYNHIRLWTNCPLIIYIKKGKFIMKTFSYTIKDQVGIHARPAGLLVKKAKEFESVITLEKGGKTAAATKLMAVMGMGVKCGDTVNVTAQGSDEETAAEEMKEFFKANL